MLSLEKKEWIIKQKKIGKLTDSQIAMSQGISRRYVQKIWVIYKKEGLKEKKHEFCHLVENTKSKF